MLKRNILFIDKIDVLSHVFNVGLVIAISGEIL